MVEVSMPERRNLAELDEAVLREFTVDVVSHLGEVLANYDAFLGDAKERSLSELVEEARKATQGVLDRYRDIYEGPTPHEVVGNLEYQLLRARRDRDELREALLTSLSWLGLTRSRQLGPFMRLCKDLIERSASNGAVPPYDGDAFVDARTLKMYMEWNKTTVLLVGNQHRELCEQGDEIERLQRQNKELGMVSDAFSRVTLKEHNDHLALREVMLRLKTLLESEGCSCECGCDSDDHDTDCQRCLGCRIEEAVRAPVVVEVPVLRQDSRSLLDDMKALRALVAQHIPEKAGALLERTKWAEVVNDD